MLNLAILFLIPFVGTSLGASGVLILRNGMGEGTEKLILGFASGVMIAALVWSLLLPSIEVSSYFVTSAGFMLGILFLLAIDRIVPHLHSKSDKAEGMESGLSKSALLMLAVTIHNIPEGMAVGAAAAAANVFGGSFSTSIALSIGIAIQNFPEGMVVSFPLCRAGRSKSRALFEGVLSGAVEPVSSVAAFCFASVLGSLLPVFLSFAAGAMFYVVVEELIPEASEGEHSNIGTVGAAIGFVLMMVLDGIFS